MKKKIITLGPGCLAVPALMHKLLLSFLVSSVL